MVNNNTYEKTRIKDLSKELLILCAFIIGSLILSILTMDILVLPLSYYAINNIEISTYIFSNLMWLIPFCFLFYFLFMMVSAYKREKIGNGEIARLISIYILRTLAKGLLSLLVFLFIASIIIFLIYILMSKNNYMIYKFMN